MRFFLKKTTVTQIIEESEDYYIAAADGVDNPVVCWKMLFPTVSAGDEIIINTTAVELNLGTGGYHIGLCPASGELPYIDDCRSHIMKLNYTPMQHARPHLEELDEYSGIQQYRITRPVIVFSLHSQLFAAGYLLNQIKEDIRYAIIISDENALPSFMSRNISILRESQRLRKVITTGHAFGGDLEAINIYSAMVYASEVLDCDLILSGPSFGLRGSGTYLGHSAMNAVHALHAACAGGQTPYLAARISFADRRHRHRGISHHTREIIEVCLCSLRLALPEPGHLSASEKELLTDQIKSLPHQRVSTRFIDCGEAYRIFSQNPPVLSSMGRSFSDDPYLFLSAAAPVLEVISNA